MAVAGDLEFDALRKLGSLLWLCVAGLLTDFNLLAKLGTTDTLLFVDADLFLDLSFAAVGGVDGGGEGCVGLFVTFPSV